ncbi:hypothetical protein Tco_1242720, partial [Tanacetum coccineum]
INNEVSYRSLHNVSVEGRKQFTMSNKHQELTSPEQTAPALASPEQTDIAMASPKQTAIGKDSSNPFMAGSLPKTTLCVIL